MGLRLAVPEAEVIVGGILVADRHILMGDVEARFPGDGIEAVVEEHMCRLNTSVKGDLVPVATQEEEWTATQVLYGGSFHHAVFRRDYCPGAVDDVAL